MTAPASRSAASRPSACSRCRASACGPSLLEHSTEICPHCAGTGRVRSIKSAALHALRTIEEEGVRRRASEIVVSVPPNVALYLLNQKRHALSRSSSATASTVTIEADDELHAADCEIERVRRAATTGAAGPGTRAREL